MKKTTAIPDSMNESSNNVEQKKLDIKEYILHGSIYITFMLKVRVIVLWVVWK